MLFLRIFITGSCRTPSWSFSISPWKDPSFYRNRNFYEEDKGDSYYGVRGIKKRSNPQLIFWIAVFAVVGLFLQVSIIRFANSTTREARERQNEESRRYLEIVRARAKQYGTRERQMEELLRRASVDEDEKPENDMKKEDKPE